MIQHIILEAECRGTPAQRLGKCFGHGRGIERVPVPIDWLIMPQQADAAISTSNARTNGRSVPLCPNRLSQILSLPSANRNSCRGILSFFFRNILDIRVVYLCHFICILQNWVSLQSRKRLVIDKSDGKCCTSSKHFLASFIKSFNAPNAWESRHSKITADIREHQYPNPPMPRSWLS